MAIRVSTQGATQLQLGSPVIKTANFTTGRSIGGASGQIMGYWYAFMLRLPTGTSWQTNARRFLLGGGSTTTGIIGETATGNSNDIAAVWLGSDISNSATFSGALQLRPRALWRSGSSAANYFPRGSSWPGASSMENDLTGLPAITRGTDAWLFVIGVTNTAAQGDTPVWRGWGANCRIGAGGTPASQVMAAPANTNWLVSTTTHLMRNAFLAAETTTANNTPVDTTLEHIGLVQGDFPWDTANNRPHHDAIAALAGAGSNPFLTYAGLVAAQNAGSLPYANCRQGKGDLTHHWTLADLSAGLTSTGSATPETFVATNYNSLSGGLADSATIAPLHWQGGAPSIIEPAVKFQGGRGALPFTIGGTYQAGTTALQRRWVVSGTSTAVPGFDWAAVSTFGSGVWSTTDTLPIGVFDLQVRDTNDISRNVTMPEFLVGTVMLAHGQSGMAGVYTNSTQPANLLNITLSAGVQGLFLQGSSTDAGDTSYVKPVPATARLIGGQAPTTQNPGTLLLMNEWHARHPGHPLLIANMAIGGTAMADWAANAVIGQWTYLGSVGEPGLANAGGVGRVGHYAWMLRGIVDVHVIMWTPGMSVDQTTRTAYADAIDARFTNSPNAPWLVLPPWRGHRSPNDTAASVNKRTQHVDFVAERGARGILGPYWPDTVMDGNPQPANSADQGSLHSAFNSTATVGGGGSPVSDQNQIGRSRLGRGIGRALAWVYDRTIKAHGPRVVAAWFRDGTRTVIEIELGRAVRTLNGAAISNQFWVSTDGGTSFARTGFTVALDATATRAVLTSTGGAWPATNVRVDYARAWPFAPIDGDIDETLTERKLDGLLYDYQTHRGGTNLFTPAGNPLASANGSGVAVATRGSAKLLATERWTGTRNVTVRMMAPDGVTVLREKTLAITGS